MWTYQQKTGRLLRDGKWVSTGYSGHGDGKNNPDMQHVPRVGPCPCGFWDISYLGDTETHGPCVLRLTPHSGTETFGRDGFLCHGDSKENPGTASLGCIIQPRIIRDLIRSRVLCGEMTLEVVRGDGE